MYIAGYSINIISLMSLSIAIGMVVDNAIVVLENIIQHVERGSRPDQAAIFATGEMGMAISASTLTTIAVFLPMVFMGGIVGILFKQLALLTSITLVASLLTALSLTPMLASRLLRPLGENRQRKTYLFVASERVFIAIENGYKRTLGWALRHKLSVSAAALIAFIITIIVGSRLGTDYIPNFDAGDVAAVIQTEIGCNVGETERVARQIDKFFMRKRLVLSRNSRLSPDRMVPLNVGFKKVRKCDHHGPPLSARRAFGVGCEIAERIRKRSNRSGSTKCEVNGGIF
jgi:HAE1 family hydrophobic/amphiphilic exporter-1